MINRYLNKVKKKNELKFYINKNGVIAGLQCTYMYVDKW